MPFGADKDLSNIHQVLNKYTHMTVDTAVKLGISRRQFWTEIYKPRSADVEEMALGAFLDDPSNALALVSGCVGSGKSTYVLNKMGAPARIDDPGGSPLCHGFYLDLGKHVSRIQETTGQAQKAASNLPGSTFDEILFSNVSSTTTRVRDLAGYICDSF